jgi:hypothetical protein
MNFPLTSMATLARHPALDRLFAVVPQAADGPGWPSVVDWNRWREERTQEASLADLTFVAEIRPGARRLRKEKKLARLRPGLRTYEAQIVDQRSIPTRPENAHDYFNALIWMNFPKAKRTLHELSYRLQVSGLGQDSPNKRSRLGDSLTCFDEGGVVYVCGPEDDRESLVRVFCSRDDASKAEWMREHRERFTIFGHGLLEGLLLGRWDVHVSCCLLPYEASGLDLDTALAQHLQQLSEEHAGFGTIPFSPLWNRTCC